MPIKTNPVLLVLLLAWLLSWQSVKAEVIDDLYDAKIAVDDQSQRTQSNAFRLGLERVLIKVRGNNDLLSNQTIESAITKATQFVRSYSYDKQDSQLYLDISFDPKRVDEVIRNAGFPVWDKRRPSSIIWLAIQSPDDPARQVVTATEYPDIYQEISLRAAQRGVSVMFPLWDLTDIQTLSVYDIWGGFSGQISLASERYAVQSVLSARIYLSNTQASNGTQVNADAKLAAKWSADWAINEGGGLSAGQVQADNPVLIADALIDTLVEKLSLKYAVDLAQVDRADTKVHIVVNNVDSLNYYIQIVERLKNMSVVNDATLIMQQGTRATFELDLLGDVDDLSNALSLDGKISPVVDNFGQPIQGLEFFWVK